MPPPPRVAAAQWAIASLAARRAMLAAAPASGAPQAPAAPVPPPAAPIPAPGAPATGTPPAVTADQIRTIIPNANGQADQYAAAFNAAMAAHGVTTAAQQAAFLAQTSVESGDLQNTSDNLNYRALRIVQVWPSRYPTVAAAFSYEHNPEALGNNTYANRNGNGDEASGDGYRFRGRGLMQVTGRANYRAQGFEDNPEALANPVTAADTAATFWANNNLNAPTPKQLDRAHFDQISRMANGGTNGQAEWWAAYQRALTALPGAIAAPPAPSPAASTAVPRPQ